MAGINAERQAEKITAFKLEHLEGVLIQSLPDSYIDTMENVDQAETNKIKASSWSSVFKQAAENLRIPFNFAPQVLVRLREEGYMKSAPPKEGAQSVISRIYFANNCAI